MDSLFQSQGRFFGGCCPRPFWSLVKLPVVSIAGAILWGVLRPIAGNQCHIQIVSIAGAILWGVLPYHPPSFTIHAISFNRRGDSLGGAAPGIRCKRRGKAVSIAGAILWGVLHHVVRLAPRPKFVSIAGAILWGVLRYH